MFFADQLLNSSFVTALGWTLVHFLWQGCVIALVYWLVCVLAPRYAAGLRYWAGLSGMLLSLLVLLFTFFLSYAPEASFGIEAAPATAVNPFLVLSGGLPDGWLLLESGLEPVLPWVVLLWFAGVVIVSYQTIGDWMAVRSLLKEGLVSTEIQLQVALESIKVKLGVQLAVRLLASTRVVVPLAVGILRPVILLPVGVIARLPQDQLEMIVAHELGHIRRFDYAFNLLQVILETVLFYHPAISWMSQRVREDREHCCDELVVRQCGRPATYARALANLEVMRSPILGAAVSATGGNLLARIKLIVDNNSPGKRSILGQFVLAALAGFGVVFGAQQGYSLSNELNRVALSVQLQASDVQWKTWGRSREIWSEGISRYAQSKRKQQLAVLKIESLSLQHLVEPEYELVSVNNLNPAEALHSGSGIPEPIRDVVASNLAIAQQPLTAESLVSKPSIEQLSLIGDLELASTENQPENASDAQSSGADQAKTEFAKPLLAASNKAEVKPLKSRAPNYPWRARRQGIEGFVELEFSVDDEGRVKDVKVLDAMPEGVFEKAASKALSRWTFDESNSAGDRFRQVFDFELKDTEKVSPRHRDCISTGSRTCGQISPGVFVVWVNGTTRMSEITGLNQL